VGHPAGAIPRAKRFELLLVEQAHGADQESRRTHLPSRRSGRPGDSNRNSTCSPILTRHWPWPPATPAGSSAPGAGRSPSTCRSPPASSPRHASASGECAWPPSARNTGYWSRRRTPGTRRDIVADRQAGHRVGSDRSSGTPMAAKNPLAVHATGVQRPRDGHGVAADGGGLQRLITQRVLSVAGRLRFSNLTLCLPVWSMRTPILAPDRRVGQSSMQMT
jgi:hypothetical protein